MDKSVVIITTIPYALTSKNFKKKLHTLKFTVFGYDRTLLIRILYSSYLF